MSTPEVTSATYPVHPEQLPTDELREGRYLVRFARDESELQAAQRLRFEVFNLEMNEGLAESFETGLDQDRFDAVCHHLLVIETRSEAVVGTYRIQTSEMAADFGGFYSADEYDFASMPADILARSVEVGRACVARKHRNRMVLFLLWKGLANYMVKTEKRFLFGCCSVTSQDPAEGKHVMDYLEAEGHVHPSIALPARPGWECYETGFDPAPPAEEVVLPRLFRTYLRFNARVISEAALDRAFKTIDYLVLFDVEAMDPTSRKMFFG